MKKAIWFIGAIALSGFIMSCNKGNSSFKKLKNGMEYKIISNGSGKTIAYGEVMKFHFAQKYKDSLLKDTYSQLPQYQPIDSMQLPKEYFEIFKQVRTGDSIVTRILTDSIFKGGMGMMPPGFKKGEHLTTTFKVLGILKSETAQDDFMKERTKFMQEDSIRAIGQKVKDEKTLEEYFAKNNIKPTKTALGTYVEVKQAGSELPQDGQTLVVKYTGKLLDGTVFDSNVDSTFRHTEPYNVTLGQGGSIKGFEDGLKSFGKGGKGNIFIPSVLGYGSQGSGKIKPNSNLVFEVEILDVLSSPKPAPPVPQVKPDTAKRPAKPLAPALRKKTP
ncbi:MAG: FKBP-type peptidyl-prolyl cis-trans isomerase [Agriterribacter sp.]